MQVVSNIKIPISQDDSVAIEKAKKQISGSFSICKIAKKSIDARDKNDIKYVYTIKFFQKGEYEDYIQRFDDSFERYKGEMRPIIIGFGPAGIFAALKLARSGARPIIFERGGDVHKRKAKVNEFWKGGMLNENSNVQFGEGGAGTFSDGKLTTQVNSELCEKVLFEFVKYGAPKDIEYLSKPHIGTDKLPTVIENIREEILSLGGEIYFDSLVYDLIIENGTTKGVRVRTQTEDKFFYSNVIILAIGHSSRDTYKMLFDKGILMEAKAFSVGVRIEHKRTAIAKAQFGKFANCLKSAEYKLVYHDKTQSAYTFCMCPGGSVVAATSEKNCVVTNGMSEYARDGENSNSALLVGVPKFEGVLDGMNYQRNLEQKAFILGGENYAAPMQLVGDFLTSKTSICYKSVQPSYSRNIKPTNLEKLFDSKLTSTLKHAITDMDKRLNGFAFSDAILTAVETRTSAPLRILRDENYESVALKGLFPCGEGAGYAGGIMSAAIDGLKVASRIISPNIKSN